MVGWFACGRRVCELLGAESLGDFSMEGYGWKGIFRGSVAPLTTLAVTGATEYSVRGASGIRSSSESSELLDWSSVKPMVAFCMMKLAVLLVLRGSIRAPEESEESETLSLLVAKLQPAEKDESLRTFGLK